MVLLEKTCLEGIGKIKFTVCNGDEQIRPFIEVMGIFVDSEHRRKGYGSKLVKELKKEAKKRNISDIYIKVSKHNGEYKAFLEKNGFKPVDTKELYALKAMGKFSRLRNRIKKKNVRGTPDEDSLFIEPDVPHVQTRRVHTRSKQSLHGPCQRPGA